MVRVQLAITAAVLGLSLIACGRESRPSLTGPSAIETPLPAGSSGIAAPASSGTLRLGGEPLKVSWECLTHDDVRSNTAVSSGAWTVAQELRAGCATGAARSSNAMVTAGLFAPGPNNLRSVVTSDTVRIDWDQAPGAGAWQIEVGSGPGLSNLATFRTEVRSLVATAVPSGVYYVRVRSAPPDFSDFSVPSNEIIVAVGTGGPSCVGPPPPPSGLFLQSLTGFNVAIAWVAPAGVPVSSFVVEVGSTTGASNVLVIDTGSAATSLQGAAAAGVYYVRVRTKNGCGLSGASNEIVIAVGVAAPPANIFYVSEARGNDNNSGGATTPFRTIQRGINAVAARGGGAVWVSGGSYVASIPIRLTGNLELVGGYNPDTWASEPGRFVTRIDAREVTGAIVGDAVSNVALRHLTIAGRAQAGNGNPALALTLSSVTAAQIHDCVILAGRGGDGNDGADGAAGSIGRAGGNGGGAGNGARGLGVGSGTARGGDGAAGVTGVAVRGATGSEGGGGAPGGLGGLSSLTDEHRDGARGSDAFPGGSGNHGAPAAEFGEVVREFSLGFLYPPTFGSGGQPGRPGQGGGGGGSGGVLAPIIPLISGGGGGGGEGGSAGLGGRGGQSGGASIAILLVSGTRADLQRNTISTAGGGDGGAGGRGGSGGRGGAGGLGGGSGVFQGAGGRGGIGGTGGSGGHGGSGNGGASVGIMHDASSTFTGTNQFTIGPGGAAGINPAVAIDNLKGSPGRTAQTLRFP